ncbi:MAG: hypothetical protein KIT13_01645 [Burkholderiales bacterium]|nr:hypothetical protein [Burkholderiales bacterium]MCW5603062.1 hypothetical protein [Burkholderiales bacterium]
MNAAKAQRRQEWFALYEELRSVLATFGREDPYGKGDFWLVEDDYGGYTHKVCVTRLPFLTGAVAAAVQRTIAKYPSPWEVVIALDYPDPSRPIEGEGVLVRRSKVEQQWNPERLISRYGEDFRWSNG